MLAVAATTLVLHAARPVPEGTLRAAARIVSVRLKRLGGSGVVQASGGRIVVSGRIPAGAAAALGAPGRFEIYDLEASLVASRRGTVRCGGVCPARRYRVVGKPALSNADLARSSIATGFDPQTARPVVLFRFDAQGARRFRALTRRLARRGRERRAPQHVAIVVDGRMLSWPQIDYLQYPNGISPAGGAEITGFDRTVDARAIAAELSSGPLPVRFS